MWGIILKTFINGKLGVEAPAGKTMRDENKEKNFHHGGHGEHGGRGQGWNYRIRYYISISRLREAGGAAKKGKCCP
jgi:hypothetical protein